MTTMQLELLNNKKIPLPDLTIGQAMDIAKLPAKFNEKRIGALISYLTGNHELALEMTAQERYYTLINHLSIADNKYIEDIDYSRYFLNTNTSKVPDFADIDGVKVHHLLGQHLELLEQKCENVFDWLSGVIACQFSGNIGELLGFDEGDEAGDWQWQPLNKDSLININNHELNELIMLRFNLLSNLNEFQYNILADIYYIAIAQLAHFVELSFDNNGLTVITQSENQEQGGDGDNKPVRFLSLTHLRGISKSLAECLV